MSQEIVMTVETENVETTPAESIETEATPKLTKENLERLLSDGKKALMMNNLEAACDKLGSATALSVELFNDFAVETYAPHFYYGKALLSLASIEKEILESKLQDDSVVQELKEGIMALAETLTNEANEANEPTESVHDEVKTSENEVVEPDADTSKQDEIVEVDADQTLNKEDDEVDDEEDEEAETGQLAFESLDYARIVCEKNTDNSTLWLERQKETFILLSQASLDVDNLDAAVEDLNSALEIVDAHFPEDYREASFVHLELGRVLRKNKQFSKASDHLDKSIAALQKFKVKLQSEPKEDISLADVDEMLDDLRNEKKITKINEAEEKKKAQTELVQLRETEEKENSQKPSNIDENVDTVSFKRKEKRVAEESVDDLVDSKKSKGNDVVEPVVEEAQA